MAHVNVWDESVDLDSPTLVEGLPGIGLVGKIATDHVVSEFDMTYYASLACPEIPKVAVYHERDSTVLPPVRIYADEERDLLALQSDVPVAVMEVGEFASCLTGWLAENDVLPMYFSGLPQDVGETPERAVYGVATGAAADRLDDHGIDPPSEDGVWSGPTGALLHRATEVGLDALGVIVESDPQFPDPEAAATLVERAIGPIAGIDVNVADLREHAEEIKAQKEQFAQHMHQTTDENSSRAEPMQMYQ